MPSGRDIFLERSEAVRTAAEETFGSAGKADRWLRRPSQALKGNTPISLLGTAKGCRQVRDLLARVDHGLAA